MVTLKDIAKQCGVSFSTVSKALQESSEISSETIKLVQQKAQEMGYHPNIVARTLRTNRTHDLGIIFEDKTGSGFQHQYFAKIISGLQQAAQEHHFDITFTGPGTNKNYDYYKHITGKSFDGIVILSADFNRPDLQKLIASGIPTATLDYYYNNSHICVLSDNEQGMSELTRYVISKGHKKIAMIYGEDTLVTKKRKECFINILRENNICICDDYFVQARYHDPLSSQNATKKLLELQEKPTCIFFPDDYSALGGITQINSQNLVIGKDISIVGYDGIMLSSMLMPPLTTFEQNGIEIGKQIALSLINKIENKELPSQNPITISGRLLTGGTVANLNFSR